jgi:hypothetical protein
MQTLDPHIEYRLERLHGEAKNRRLAQPEPRPELARPWVTPRTRRVVGVAATLATLLLMVSVAAIGGIQIVSSTTASDAPPASAPAPSESTPLLDPNGGNTVRRPV